MLPYALKRTISGTLVSLFKLAYNSRLTLPLLVSAGFMIFDLHMRLEIEMEAHIQPENNNEEQEDL